MSFSDALAQRRLLGRPYLEFSGIENPSISGYIGTTPFRFGFAGDNTGTVPVRGTALSFGSFTRALANDRLSIETPRASITLADKDNQWKRWAANPWVLSRRYMEVGLNLRNRDGTYTEGAVFGGLSKDVKFDGGQVSFSLYDTFGEVFSETLPADRVDLESWPNAHASAAGKPYPIVYGKADNSLDYVQNAAAALSSPSGAVVTGLTAIQNLASGVSTPGTYTYNVAPVLAGVVIGAPATATVTVTTTSSAVTLSWAYSGPATSFAVWVTTNDFLQMGRAETGATSLVDQTPGYWYPSAAPSGSPYVPTFTLSYRQTVSYYISATVAGLELTTGPLIVPLTPMNYEAQRYVSLTWNAVTGATAITIRRALQTYHWAGGVDKQWTIAGSATSFTDWLTDTTPASVTEAPVVNNTRPGAVGCLYVDTNPGGGGTFRYVAARGAVKSVRNVFVTKTPVTDRGTPLGSLKTPSNVTVTQTGATGDVKYKYKITAVNRAGETTASSAVEIEEGVEIGSMNGANYNTLTCDYVDGAFAYRVYRQAPQEDFGYIFESNDYTNLRDLGYLVNLEIPPPETNTTGDNFESGEAPTRAYPIRQTEGVDYTVSYVTYKGVLLTVLDFTTDQGDFEVTADIWGVESVGDGSGTLITGFFDQLKHFLCNFVFANYMEGAWFTNSPFVKTSSFTAAQTASEDRVPGGYIGAGALTEATTIQQAIYDWLMCTDADLYYWEGQLHISLPVDPDEVDTSTLARLTPQDGILDQGFQTEIDDGQVFTVIPWRGGAQFDGYRLSGSVKNSIGQSLYGVRNSPVTTLAWLRDLPTIVDCIERKRVSWAQPRVYASFKVPLRYAMTELSTLLLVTHPDGLSDSPRGWSDRLVKLIRTDVNLGSNEVSVTVEDLGLDPLNDSEAPSSSILLETFMPSFLGGHRDQSLYYNTYLAQYLLTNYQNVIIDWDQFDTPVEAVFVIDTLVAASGAQATPKVYCVETASIVASGSAISYNATQYANREFTTVSLTVAASTGVRNYRIIYDANFGSGTYADILAVANVRLRSSLTSGFGNWTDVVYNAGHYTGSGTITWTVQAGDVEQFAYTYNGGKSIRFKLGLLTTTLAGTGNILYVTLPFTASTPVDGVCRILDNGSPTIGFLRVNAGSNQLQIFRENAANFAASTNLTAVLADFTMRVA